jgi:hypothetical protein
VIHVIDAKIIAQEMNMKHFTIENETNNITVHATGKDAKAVANAATFRDEAGC